MENTLKSVREVPGARPGDDAVLAPRPAVSVSVLTGDASLFAGLTFSRFRRSLGPLAEGMVAVGAISLGCPVGLALGTFSSGDEADLLSIAVAPAQRRGGIGLRLLEAWETEMRRQGARRATARYNETMAGRAGLEALASRAGWLPPEEDGMLVIGKAGAMAEVVGGWRTIADRLAQPSLYSFAPVELSMADVAAVERYLSQPEAANMLGPIELSLRLAPAFSVLIRRRGELVGWVLATATDEPSVGDHVRGAGVAVRYLEAFLDPAYWHSGITIGAYHHCYAEQARLLGRESTAIYYTNPTRPRMVAMTRRRFAPIADRVETIVAVRRQLDPKTSRPSSRGAQHGGQ